MIEEELSKALFTHSGEKTFIDKLLGKDDVNSVREIIRKKKLSREDLLDVLYMLASNESKLLNYSDWDRYVILKFYVWIREFVKVAELLYDYQDDLHLKQKLCSCGGYINLAKSDKPVCKCESPSLVFKISTRTKRLLENNERLIEHNAKFLIDLYFNIGRTSLSLGGTGFLEILKNKFEINYPHATQLAQQQENKGGLLRLRK